MMQWLYKLGSPRHFYEMTTGFVPWLSGISLLLLVIGIVLGLGFAPPDYQMGDNYRILYIHASTALGGMGAYLMLGLMAAMHMIWNIKVADVVAKVTAPVGAAYTALGLITGALWGKPTWGTYWIWDARLTSYLILFFLFLGVMALRSAYDSENAGSKAASVLSIVGVVNLPIIYYSVYWWQTLHQVSSDLSASSTAANPPSVWIPIMFVGYAVVGLFFLAVILRARNEILYRERRAQWVQDLLKTELANV